MPRPKGSKNKPHAPAESVTLSPGAIEEKMNAIAAEIESLTAQLKDKKAELKTLAKEKEAAIAAEAAAKAEADKAAILEAVAASGKSVDEILELLK